MKKRDGYGLMLFLYVEFRNFPLLRCNVFVKKSDKSIASLVSYIVIFREANIPSKSLLYSVILSISGKALLFLRR